MKCLITLVARPEEIGKWSFRCFTQPEFGEASPVPFTDAGGWEWPLETSITRMDIYAEAAETIPDPWHVSEYYLTGELAELFPRENDSEQP